VEEETLIENHSDGVERTKLVVVEPNSMVAVEARYDGIVHLYYTFGNHFIFIGKQNGRQKEEIHFDRKVVWAGAHLIYSW
jgi:hypothetical protein